jgi:signal transduction histidine kinase
MLAVLLLAILLLTLVGQLVRAIHANHQKHSQLILIQQQLDHYTLQLGHLSAIHEKNQDLFDLYNALGQSIAALHIQIQVAQKLWKINPPQAQQSLSEAYQLSGSLMYEVRQIVRVMGEETKKQQNYSVSYTGEDHTAVVAMRISNG